MEYEKIKEWLDLLVEDLKRDKEHADFNSQIFCSRGYDNNIPICGIGKIADIMKLSLNEEKEHGSEFGFNYRYSFEYAGVTFVGYECERLEKHVPV